MHETSFTFYREVLGKKGILLTLIKHINGRTAAQNHFLQELCSSHPQLKDP